MVAGLEELEDGIQRRQAGAKGEAVGRPLETGHVPLQCFPGGVLGAGVFVTPMFPEPLLDVGGGLVDRGHDRARQRLRHLAGMHGAGSESELMILGEDTGHARRIT
jgi:hypothetical protein